MKAALFDSNQVAVKIMTASMAQISANVPAGGSWREIPGWVEYLQDVPAHGTLPTWPDRIGPDLELSSPTLPDVIELDANNQFTMGVVTGFSVMTTDNLTFVESGGTITITFNQSGDQYVREMEVGKDPYTRNIWVIPYSDRLNRLKRAVDDHRDQKLVAPLTVGGVTLDGDLTAQKNIAEAATFGAFQVLGGNTGWTMDWITAANTTVTLTAAELEAFTALIASRRSTEYMASRTTKDNIMAAADMVAAEAAAQAYLVT